MHSSLSNGPRPALVLCAVLASAVPAGAHADTSADTSDDIVVTAQKRAESIQKVPIAITAISGDALTDSGAGRTAGEIVRFVPNASAATLDNHGFPRWFLRGIGTGEPSLNNVTPISVYADEVYLGSAFMTGGPLFDLERVEVLPGPQGTLWGRNSPGGAIHSISRKPKYESEGFVDASIANYANRRIQATINEPLGDSIAVRISGSSEGGDLYAYNIAKGARGRLSDNAVRGQVAFKLGEGFDGLLNVHYRRFKQNDMTSYVNFGQPGQTDSYGNPYAVFPDRVYNFNAPGDTLRQQFGTSLTLHKAIGDYDFTSITAYERVTETSRSDGDNLPQEISRSYADNAVDQISQEFRLTSPREDRFNWIVGAYLFDQGIRSFSAGASLNIPTLHPGTTPQFNNSAYTHGAKNYAVFGSASYAITSRLKLTAGIRWTYEQKDLVTRRRASSGAVNFTNTSEWWLPGAFTGTLNTTVSYANDRTWRAVTWDISPEYEIADNARIYARVARGFRGGGFIAQPSTQAGAGTFDPEYLTDYEAGIKSEWLGGRLTLNAAAFYYDYKDIQINIQRFDPDLGRSVSRMQNAANATVYGAEFQASAAIGSRLRLRGSVGLLHTEYKDYRDSLGNDYSGNSFARAPSFTGVFSGEYTLPVAGRDLTLAGDVNTRSSFVFNATDPDNPAQQTKGYTLVNLRAAYKLTDDLRLTGFVDNLTDKAYWQATQPISLTAIGKALGAPRTYGLAINYRW